MTCIIRFVAAVSLLTFSVTTRRCHAEEGQIEDIVIRWSPEVAGGTRDVTLYVNGELIGTGREGMESVLAVVRTLPRGASIVWGPGIEKKKRTSNIPSKMASTVPVVFPDLWKQLVSTANARGLFLSSKVYPDGPWPTLNEVSKAVAAGSPRGADDVIVAWELDDTGSLDLAPFGRDAAGILDLKRHLGAQPKGRTVRFVLDPKMLSRTGGRIRSWDSLAASDYDATLARVIQNRGLHGIVEIPAGNLSRGEKAPHVASLSWSNFDRQAPNHDNVVYSLDNHYVGLGDRGFDAVLRLMDEQPNGTLLYMPGYDGSLDKQRDGPYGLPFQSRRTEFEDRLRSRSISLDKWTPRIRLPKQKWFLEVGAIVRDGRAPHAADVILGWRSFDPRARNHDKNDAVYTVNGTEVGQGLPGFLTAIAKIEEFPVGAVLRIDPVCVKTRGPFDNAVILPGQRHFERTGSEPYDSYTPILVDVVERKKLMVEFVPDEKEPAHD